MKNEYEIRGDITAIIINSPKYGRQEALINTCKLERVNEFAGTWSVVWGKEVKSFYVSGHLPNGNGKQATIGLHRWITNAPKRMVVDHINHNTLDNTDDNLRIVTKAENSQNRKGAQSISKSGIRGVFWNKTQKKWQGRVKVSGKFIHVGSFETIEEAASATESARSRLMPFSIEALKA